MTTMEIIKFILSGVFGTVGFSILFKVKKERIFFIAIGGALVAGVYLVSCKFTDYPLLQNLFPALTATVYSELMARLLKLPATPVLACSIISLVPGGKLYYTTYHLVMGNDELFRTSLTETVEIAAGLAIGIICVSVVMHEINRQKFKNVLKMD